MKYAQLVRLLGTVRLPKVTHFCTVPEPSKLTQHSVSARINISPPTTPSPPSLANFHDIPSSSSASASSATRNSNETTPHRNHDLHNRHSHQASQRGTGPYTFCATLVQNSMKLICLVQGHIVTLEITSGQTYRGKLLDGTHDIPSFRTIY